MTLVYFIIVIHYKEFC